MSETFKLEIFVCVQTPVRNLVNSKSELTQAVLFNCTPIHSLFMIKSSAIKVLFERRIDEFALLIEAFPKEFGVLKVFSVKFQQKMNLKIQQILRIYQGINLTLKSNLRQMFEYIHILFIGMNLTLTYYCSTVVINYKLKG